MVTKYPFDRQKKVIYNEKKRSAKSLTPQSGFVVRDLNVVVLHSTKMGHITQIMTGNLFLQIMPILMQILGCQ